MALLHRSLGLPVLALFISTVSACGSGSNDQADSPGGSGDEGETNTGGGSASGGNDSGGSSGGSTASGGSSSATGGNGSGGGDFTDPGSRSAWPMGTSYILSGHSLTDSVISHPWPGRLVEAVTLDAAGAFEDVRKATIPGSSINWRWNNAEPGGDQGAAWPEDMPSYEGLVITLAVPLLADDGARQTDQVDWLKTATDDAWANGNGGNGAPTLLYTTWTNLTAEPGEPHPEDNLSFRERLDLDAPRWEAMQDFVNDNRPAGQAPLYLIPGHRFMMRVADDISAGTAPFSDITDLFEDNIHPNATGRYGVTLLHYAVIYGRDPGAFLPNTLVGEDDLSSEQAEYFKTIVADIVTSYPRTGLTSLTTP